MKECFAALMDLFHISVWGKKQQKTTWKMNILWITIDTFHHPVVRRDALLSSTKVFQSQSDVKKKKMDGSLLFFQWGNKIRIKLQLLQHPSCRSCWLQACSSFLFLSQLMPCSDHPFLQRMLIGSAILSLTENDSNWSFSSWIWENLNLKLKQSSWGARLPKFPLSAAIAM